VGLEKGCYLGPIKWVEYSCIPGQHDRMYSMVVKLSIQRVQAEVSYTPYISPVAVGSTGPEREIY
jgi:hypothetical protein